MKKQYTTVFVLMASIFFTYHCTVADWVQTGGPGGGYVICLAAQGDTVLVGMNGGGIFRSTNGGVSWAPANNGLDPSANSIYVYALFIHGTQVYAGANGIFQSSDFGLTWDALPLNQYVSAFAATENYLFAGSSDSGVFRSSDTAHRGRK